MYDYVYNGGMYILREADNKFKNLLVSPKITIIVGARQVGKTTLVKHALNLKNSLFLNFDIDIDKQKILSATFLSPKDAMQSFGNPDYLIIDEAQRLPQIGSIVKGWYDSGFSPKIILLGSSSLDLLNKSAESLTGRNEKLFITPLQFGEIVRSKEWYSDVYTNDEIENNFSNQLRELLMQSIVFGNYPAVLFESDQRQYLLNLISDYLFKDVLQMGMIKTPELIKKLLTLLAHQIGSEVSINELASSLGMARATIERYLDLLEQTFVIFRLPAFSTNSRKEISKSHKIYFWDTGVRNAILNEFSFNPLRSDIGHLWENWVVAEFAKQNILSGSKNNLYFWRSRTGSEIDLVVKEGEKISAYEIKWKDKKSVSRAFAEKYGVAVETITSAHPLIKL
jgi:uncharacterized protein